MDTPGLEEDVSVSLTAAEGFSGAELVVGHTLSVFQKLPVFTGQTVVFLRTDTRSAGRVTLLTVIGVLVSVGTIGTLGDTNTLWEKKVIRI